MCSKKNFTFSLSVNRSPGHQRFSNNTVTWEGIAMETALKTSAEQAFSDYVEQNGITDHTASGLYYAKSLTTKGAMVDLGQTAVIRYEAYFLDGTPLGYSDQLGQPYEVEYGRHKVLAGLEEAISLLHVGEKGRFVLPYTLAYGEHPYGIIPACSNLIFDIELLEIK